MAIGPLFLIEKVKAEQWQIGMTFNSSTLINPLKYTTKNMMLILELPLPTNPYTYIKIPNIIF